MAIAVLVFLVITVLVYAVGRRLMRSDRNVDPQVLAGARTRPLVFGPLTLALAGVLPCSPKARESLTRHLGHAGYYHRHALEEFLSIRNALCIGWLLLTGTVAVIVVDGSHHAIVPLAAGFLGVLLLYSLPTLILHSLAGDRLRRIQYTLPDALDMITMSMAAGLPIHDAVRRVAQDMKGTAPDLACELQIVSRQGELGSFDKALRQFATRTELPDIQSLAAMVGQAEIQGSRVADALEEFADGIRRQRRQRAEEQGNKTSVKLLMPLVFCLAPPVYIMLLSPAVIEMRNFVLHENRPGGILAPQSAVGDAGTGSATGERATANARRPLSPQNATFRRSGGPSSETAPARPGGRDSQEPVDLRIVPVSHRRTARAASGR